jgi:hydroxymethylbilane synthase
MASAKDPLSLVYLERVIGLLRDAHPRYEFVDFRDLPGGGRRGAKGYGHAITMLTKNAVDIVVVDAREIPLRLQSNVALVAVLDRSNPFDVLVARDDLILDEQPENVRLAVTDRVSRVQLLYYRPDLVLSEEAGDMNDLYRLMENNEIDGFVTAAMEVEALNQQNRVIEVFTSSICTPKAGQGAIGLIARSADKSARSAVSILNDPSSYAEVELERKFLERVSKDGRIPVGVLAKMEGDTFEVEATIIAPDGSEKIAGALDGVIGQEEEVIEKLVGELLASGGDRIIKRRR